MNTIVWRYFKLMVAFALGILFGKGLVWAGETGKNTPSLSPPTSCSGTPVDSKLWKEGEKLIYDSSLPALTNQEKETIATEIPRLGDVHSYSVREKATRTLISLGKKEDLAGVFQSALGKKGLPVEIEVRLKMILRQAYPEISFGVIDLSPQSIGLGLLRITKKEGEFKKSYGIGLGGSLTKGYDEISQPVFDAAGRRWAYVAREGNKWVVVVDGVEEKKQYDNAWSPVFSPGGRHWAYVAREGNKWVAVVDGVEGKKYDFVSSFVFSPGGRHWAYVAQKGNKPVMVVDGVEEKKQYDNVWSVPGFERLAHSTQVEEKKQYDNAWSPVFSPGGRHWAYVAQKGNKPVMVVDGVEEKKQYDDIWDLVFSPNGWHWAHNYRWMKDNNSHGEKNGKRGEEGILLDGIEYGPYAKVSNVVFSCDSQKAAFYFVEEVSPLPNAFFRFKRRVIRLPAPESTPTQESGKKGVPNPIK